MWMKKPIALPARRSNPDWTIHIVAKSARKSMTILLTKADNFRKISFDFWHLSATGLVEQLNTTVYGLTSTEAKQRLSRYGPNRLRTARKSDALNLLLAQFKTPLILILLSAAALSLFLHEPIDASIIIAIVLLSGVLGFYQEKRAADAVKSLLAMVKIEANVIRNGVETAV